MRIKLTGAAIIVLLPVYLFSGPATAEYVESDFYWDNKTTPHKAVIIAGVNKVAKENKKCGIIDPSSAYISGSKGTAKNPVFYVTCGKGASTFNAFFSKADVEADMRLSATKHIDKAKGVSLCEAYAKNRAAHPSTVDFSRVMALSANEHPNGRTTISSTFTAKNALNVEAKYKISCLLDAGGLIEATIHEANTE